MSGNIKTINSSNAESNLFFKDWHKKHHNLVCHHNENKCRKFKDIKQSYLLIGTPNVGKSTFFNKITSSYANVSNVDRLTVEDKIGQYRSHKDIGLIDLPGVYNLSHPLDEEKVVSHEIFDEYFDKIINIIAAPSIQRDLLLTIQCIETGLTNTVVINMRDEIVKDGININVLRKYLSNVCVVTTQANRSVGIKKAEQCSINSKFANPNIVEYPSHIENYISQISKILPQRKIANRFYALMILEGNEYIKQEIEAHFPQEYEKITKLLKGKSFYNEIMSARRTYINRIIAESTTIHKEKFLNFNKKKHYSVDRWILNKWIGIPAFILLMIAIYFISFGPWTGGKLQTLIADDLFTKLIIDNLHNHLIDQSSSIGQWFGGMFVDGMLQGFVAVLSFIPVILILFTLVNIVNQVGILSRVSVLLDQTFSRFGISGRGVVSLLTGFGCNVPAIMMARSANSKKERIISVLIAPFVACSARVIVFAYVSNFLFGAWGWVATIGLTIASGFIALFMGLMFSQILFRRSKSFFLVEMVTWRKPDFVVIFKSVWQQLKEFIKKAGIFIVLASLIIWLLLHIYPTHSFNQWYNDDLDGTSLLGYTSRGLQYLFVPIGFGDIIHGVNNDHWDDGWRLTASLLSALPAKEIAIANLNMLYGDGFTHCVPEGLSYLVMLMLMLPCTATCVVLKKETNWKYFGISILSSFMIAYILAMVVYWLAAVITF